MVDPACTSGEAAPPEGGKSNAVRRALLPASTSSRSHLHVNGTMAPQPLCPAVFAHRETKGKTAFLPVRSCGSVASNGADFAQHDLAARTREPRRRTLHHIAKSRGARRENAPSPSASAPETARARSRSQIRTDTTRTERRDLQASALPPILRPPPGHLPKPDSQSRTADRRSDPALSGYFHGHATQIRSPVREATSPDSSHPHRVRARPGRNASMRRRRQFRLEPPHSV